MKQICLIMGGGSGMLGFLYPKIQNLREDQENLFKKFLAYQLISRYFILYKILETVK